MSTTGSKPTPRYTDRSHGTKPQVRWQDRRPRRAKGGEMRRRRLDPRPRALVALSLACVMAVAAPSFAAVRVYEKSANLDISLRVAEELRARGVIVRMTRTTDATLEPEDRTGL